MTCEMVQADVLDWCKEYDGPSFHAMLCDPPYELNFMGRDWDRSGIAFDPATWAALKEHLLPGAFIFVFGSSRGWHRLAVAIEDAGFVFHPSLMVWGALQGQGFPKSTRIDTQIDRAAGKTKEREVLGVKVDVDGRSRGLGPHSQTVYSRKTCYGQDNRTTQQIKTVTAPATDLARAWEGHRYGRQALKPAVEMIICAQKPYEGRPVDSIVETGAGALFIDGGRVGLQDGETTWGSGRSQSANPATSFGDMKEKRVGVPNIHSTQGRWPPNFCLIHSPDCQRAGTKRVKNADCTGEPSQVESHDPVFGRGQHNITYADSNGLETVDAWHCVKSCAARRIGEQSGVSKSTGGDQRKRKGAIWGPQCGTHSQSPFGFGDTGSCARYFPQFGWAAEIAERLANSDQVRYCSKASRGEREAGLSEAFPLGKPPASGRSKPASGRKNALGEPRRNHHPCVKNISLCRWLATLLLPPPEYAPRRLLVPFCGVASEMIAAGLAGWEEIVGIEREVKYCEIGRARLAHWLQQPQLSGLE